MMWSVPLSIDINAYRKNLEEAEVQKVQVHLEETHC